jgi:hypothetical protein
LNFDLKDSMRIKINNFVIFVEMHSWIYEEICKFEIFNLKRISSIWAFPPELRIQKEKWLMTFRK